MLPLSSSSTSKTCQEAGLRKQELRREEDVLNHTADLYTVCHGLGKSHLLEPLDTARESNSKQQEMLRLALLQSQHTAMQ